jgi:hypothetical protein
VGGDISGHGVSEVEDHDKNKERFETLTAFLPPPVMEKA